MNNLQLIILISILLVIVLGIIYYYIRERKIQALIKNSFNQSTKDIVLNNQAIVLDGIDQQKATTKANVQVTNIDISQPKLNESNQSFNNFKDEKLPSSNKSLNATNLNNNPANLDTNNLQANLQLTKASNLDSTSSIANQIETNLNLDYHLDIEFKDYKTIKYLPDLSHITNKKYQYYIFNKDNTKILFKSGKKHTTKHIELEVSLIDHNGLVNQAQIANIYNDISKITAAEQVTLTSSDYVNDIIKIGKQLKHLSEVKLNLVLLIAYLAPSKDMLRFLTKKLVMQNNSFTLCSKNNQIICTIQPSKDTDNTDYKLLSLNCAMHLQENPTKSLDEIFDFIDLLGAQFDIRILNTNHSVFNQTHYDAIYTSIDQYSANANKHGVILGGELIKRIFSN